MKKTVIIIYNKLELALIGYYEEGQKEILYPTDLAQQGLEPTFGISCVNWIRNAKETYDITELVGGLELIEEFERQALKSLGHE